MSEATLAAIDGAVASAGELLGELCAISSESGNVAGLRRVAERLGAELERHGLAVAIEVPTTPHSRSCCRQRGAAISLCSCSDSSTPAPAQHSATTERLVAGTGARHEWAAAMLVGALDVLAGARSPAGDLLLLAVPTRRWWRIAQPGSGAGRAARAVLVLEAGERASGARPSSPAARPDRMDAHGDGRAAHSSLDTGRGRRR